MNEKIRSQFKLTPFYNSNKDNLTFIDNII